MKANKLSIIGQSLPKIDAWAKVTGETKFADDMFLPRMAHGKLLRSPHPHALIKRIDTARAAALPGVYAVITGHDLPRVKFGILPVSQDLEQGLVHGHDHVPDLAVDRERELRLHTSPPWKGCPGGYRHTKVNLRNTKLSGRMSSRPREPHSQDCQSRKSPAPDPALPVSQKGECLDPTPTFFLRQKCLNGPPDE